MAAPSGQHTLGAAPAASPRRAASIAWFAVAAIVAWLVFAPLFWGLNVANDDLKFVRGNLNVGSLWENIRHGWLHTNSFRPLENLVAAACDARTLSCWPVVPLQFAGLAAIAAGIVALARRTLPEPSLAAPLILLWVLLSPGTMTALWQMDTGSQTWGAALGLWCGVVAWDIVAAARHGRAAAPRLLALLALALVGMNVKETFFGWSAAIAGGIVVAIIATPCRGRAALRAAAAIIPVAVVPFLYLVLRYKFGGLGGVTPVDEAPEGRYQIGVGDNLVTNSLMSLFGLFSNGPLHLFNDDAAPLPLRALPPASLLACGVMIIAAAAFAVLHRAAPAPLPLRAPLLAAAVCMASIAVTLPMGAVSDLYGFGPNIGSGLLVVTAGWMLWNPADPDDRGIGRGIAGASAAVLALTGLYGVGSRTYQFSMTWYYARELNRIVLAHQAALPELKGDAPALIYFPTSCYSGHIYGQIMTRPLQSMGIDSITDWINRQDPKRPVRLVVQPPLSMRPGIDLTVECDRLAKRRDW